MTLTLQPVQVATGLDEEGMLVFAEHRLIAVLVKLSDAHQEQGMTGHWFLETGYGLAQELGHPVFPDLVTAKGWISHRLAGSL